jgi:hypothetical protein
MGQAENQVTHSTRSGVSAYGMRNIPLDVETLSEREGPMVLRRRRYLLKDEDEAMDVCQGVFVRIIEQRKRLRNLSHTLMEMNGDRTQP